jgi:PTS system galactitol-specific IIC component
MGTWMAPYITQAAVDAGAALPEGASLISAVGDGWDIWSFILLWPATLSQALGWVAAVVVLALTVVGALLFKRNTSSWEALTGAKVEKAEAPAGAGD